MSPVIASMPDKENILKAPNIQIATLFCILPNIFRGYDKGALL